MSVPRTTVVADDFHITHPAAEAAALAPVLGVPETTLQAELSEHSGFVYLAKKIGNSDGQKVEALQLVGISFQADSARIDPGGPLASSVTRDGGRSRDRACRASSTSTTRCWRAEAGRRHEQAVAWWGAAPDSTTHSANVVPGTGLELTLDESLQYVTEQSLAAAVSSSHAKSGIAIVMNTHTGDILAMANLVQQQPRPHHDTDDGRPRRRPQRPRRRQAPWSRRRRTSR